MCEKDRQKRKGSDRETKWKMGATWGKRRKEITDNGRYWKSIELEAKCVVDGQEVPEEERHEGNARQGPEGGLERERGQVRDVRCIARGIRRLEDRYVDREGPEDLRRVQTGLRRKNNGVGRGRWFPELGRRQNRVAGKATRLVGWAHCPFFHCRLALCVHNQHNIYYIL